MSGKGAGFQFTKPGHPVHQLNKQMLGSEWPGTARKAMATWKTRRRAASLVPVPTPPNGGPFEWRAAQACPPVRIGVPGIYYLTGHLPDGCRRFRQLACHPRPAACVWYAAHGGICAHRRK